MKRTPRISAALAAFLVGACTGHIDARPEGAACGEGTCTGSSAGNGPGNGGSGDCVAADCNGTGANGAGASGNGGSTGAGGDTSGNGGASAGAGGEAPGPVVLTPDGVGASTRFVKLSNKQWERTVQDLFRLTAPAGFSSAFTQEAADKGYDTLAAAQLTIGSDAWTRYQTAAESVAALVTGDDAKLQKFLPANLPSDPAARATAFVRAFGLRAFRRPLTDAEVTSYTALFGQGATLLGGDAFKAGVQIVIQGMLQSPHFLYRVEAAHAQTAGEKGMLTGYEVATRLSYALWGTTPSDDLLAAAEAGELDTADGVARRAGTMLEDARAKDVIRAFHEQTFLIAGYGTQDKDPSLGFDTQKLAPVMQSEARLFFDDVLAQGGGIRELLTSPVVYVNQDNAGFYGIDGVSGSSLQKRTLADGKRKGLFMQLGFLTKNATRKTSDPVHRGLLVLRRILCDEPDPPPAMFQLPASEAGLTTRQVYEKATACGVGCHDILINPAGFAFEGFDAIGRLRTTEENKPIDATGSLLIRSGYTSAEKAQNPTTKLTFTDAVDMVTQLAETPRVHECYARNWLSYTLARGLSGAERGAGSALADVSQNKGNVKELLKALVKLDTFRARVEAE